MTKVKEEDDMDFEEGKEFAEATEEQIAEIRAPARAFIDALPERCDTQLIINAMSFLVYQMAAGAKMPPSTIVFIMHKALEVALINLAVDGEKNEEEPTRH